MMFFMARPRKIDATLVAKAQEVAAQTDDIRELRAAQAVLLPAVAQTTLEQTAKLLGVGRATVARLQVRFRRRQQEPGVSPRRTWGGRRHGLLSRDEESAFVKAWRDKALQGEVVVLTPLRVALGERVGHLVARSVVYRMVQRHGWRKVAPDTRHPKADAGVQEE